MCENQPRSPTVHLKFYTIGLMTPTQMSLVRCFEVGIELGRADCQVEGYQPRPFGCGVGSQFHHSHVSRGPPIIPDGRLYQVRFETLAFPPWSFPLSTKFKRWYAYAPPLVV